jgi:4-alpha-glucanotransferase
LPPIAALLAGDHVDLRHALGLLTRSVEEERAESDEERASWVAALVERGLVAPDASVDELVMAMHAYLGLTPARLRAVWLPDVVGDRRPANQPGTVEGYPSWRLPISDSSGRPVTLEEIQVAPGAETLARAISRQGPSVTVGLSEEPNHKPRET